MNTVVSIRMPRELLRELEVTARSQGKGPTTLARELIEQGLAGGRGQIDLVTSTAHQVPLRISRLVFRTPTRGLERRS